eukprot:GILI01011015.1.p1 GENE.GILI01011015.1~~GILI01011015.1.p1  ORF type:complete len:1406 (-),score=360.29 GILI01011015.1:141-4313(-)
MEESENTAGGRFAGGRAGNTASSTFGGPAPNIAASPLDQQPMAHVAQRIADFSHLGELVQQLTRALAAEDVERYRRVAKRVRDDNNGRTELVLSKLLKEQEGTVARLEVKQKAIDEIQSILEGGDRIAAHRERLTNLIEAAIAVQVSATEISRLLKQIDTKLQAERMDGYLSGFFDSVEGKGWTQTERRTLLDACNDLGLLVGPQSRTYRSIKGKARGSCDSVEAMIEALHYSIAAGVTGQLEEAILGTRQQLSEATTGAISSPNSNAVANFKRRPSVAATITVSSPTSAQVGRTESSLSAHHYSTAAIVAAPPPRLRLTQGDVQLIETEISAAEEELKTLHQAEQCIFDLDRLRVSVPAHRLYSYSVPQLRSEAQNYERVQTTLLGYACSAVPNNSTAGTPTKSGNLQTQQRRRASVQIHLDICQLHLDRINEIISSKLEEEAWRKKEQQAQKEFQKHVETTQAEVRQIQAASELQRQLEQHTRLENDVTSWAAQADDLYRAVQRAVASSSTSNKSHNQNGDGGSTTIISDANIELLKTCVRSANAILDNLTSSLRVYSPGYEDNTKIANTTPEKLKYRIISVTGTIGRIRSQLSTAIKFADRFIQAHNSRLAANDGDGFSSDHKNVVAVPPAIQRAIDLFDQKALIELIKKHSQATMVQNALDAAKATADKTASDETATPAEAAPNKAPAAPSAPLLQPLNQATLVDIRRQWEAKSALKLWVESLHKSVTIATSLGNAPLLKIHLDRAAERSYSDDIIKIATGRYAEMVKVKEGTSSGAEVAGSSGTPARSRANSGQGALSPDPSAPSATAAPASKAVSYRKPAVIPLEHPYDPQSAVPSDRLMAELLLSTMLMLRDCSNKPTDAAIIKPGDPEVLSSTSGAKLITVPEGTPEVKAVVNCWLSVLEHSVKPSGIFKKVPRTLFDVMKVLGEAELPNSRGTLAAPYTNRLVQDFDRIKEWNSPHGASASYFLLSYILFRDCLVPILSELLQSVPPKARNDIFLDGALLRDERCFKDLISIGYMCEQVQWGFVFSESSSVAIQQRKAAVAAASASPANQNSSTSLAHAEVSGTARAASQQVAISQGSHANPSAIVEDNEVPLGISSNIVVSGLRQAVKILGDYYYEALAKLGAKPTPDEAVKLLDERLHKGIGLVVRSSICPAIASALLVGYRSKSFMNKRYLWDFVIAAGAKLKESMRDLQAMAIPDGIELILNITDPDGRNKIYMHRLSEEQVAALRFRMFVCHLLNTNSLAAFLNTVFSDDCAQAVQVAIYQNPALAAPMQAAAASVAKDSKEDDDDGSASGGHFTVGRTVSRALLNATAPLKETPMSLVTSMAQRTAKDQLTLLHKYYHLDRCLLLCMEDSRKELLKLAVTFSKLKFLLCIDAEVW